MSDLFLNIAIGAWHLQWSIYNWFPKIKKNNAYKKSWGVFRLFNFDAEMFFLWFKTRKYNTN